MKYPEDLTKLTTVELVALAMHAETSLNTLPDNHKLEMYNAHLRRIDDLMSEARRRDVIAQAANQEEDEPLVTNEQLETLLSRANGISKTHRDTMHAALVFVRGTYERTRAAQTAVPVDEIGWMVSRYFFQIERGQDARLDRINEWLNQVKPLDEDHHE